MWQIASIVNVVVLIPNQFAYRPLHAMSTTKTTAADRLNLYTWFPFKLGGCGEVQDVILTNGSLKIMADFQKMHICTLQKFQKILWVVPLK